MLNCQKCGAANKEDAIVCRQCGTKLDHREFARALSSMTGAMSRNLVRKPVKKIKKTGKLLWHLFIFLLVLLGFAAAAAAVSLFDKPMWPDYPEKVELSDDERKEIGKIYAESQKNSENYLNILEIGRLGNYLLYDEKGERAVLHAGEGRWYSALADGGTVNFNARRKGDTFEFVFYGRLKHDIPYRLRFVFDAVRSDDGKLKLYHVTLGSLPLWGADAEELFRDFTGLLGKQGKRLYADYERVVAPRMMLHAKANDVIIFDLKKTKEKSK